MQVCPHKAVSFDCGMVSVMTGQGFAFMVKRPQGKPLS